MNNLIGALLILLVLYFMFNQPQLANIPHTSYKCDICNRTWNHKDITSSCDSFCKLKEHTISTGFEKNPDNTIICNCEKEIKDQQIIIHTPDANIPELHLISKGDNDYHYKLFEDTNLNIKTADEYLKHKIEKESSIEELSNVSNGSKSTNDYTELKNEQYLRYKNLIFGM